MRVDASILVAFCGLTAAAIPEPDAHGKYTLSAPGIRAQFIPYAATLTNLFVKDKWGTERDVVLGYDNATYYPTDPAHPVYNAVPGRYAGRIGNATFTLDNVTYHTAKNDGPNTLHSGPNNWSYRVWNLTAMTNNSITFSLHDPANSTDMPGRVNTNVTYSLSANKWSIKIEAVSPDTDTPIMPTQHTYFNLDAFQNPSTQKIWNHTLFMPHAHTVLDIDGNALPTGEVLKILRNETDDFWSQPRKLGFAQAYPEFATHCGTTCAGYNGQLINDNTTRPDEMVVMLGSEWSGIQAELRTNQPGIVLYTCYWMDGTVPMKSTQGLQGGNRNVTSDGCVAIEAMDWADGINHPTWGRLSKQIFGPGKKLTWEASWTFGLMSNTTNTTLARRY